MELGVSPPRTTLGPVAAARGSEQESDPRYGSTLSCLPHGGSMPHTQNPPPVSFTDWFAFGAGLAPKVARWA